MGETIYHSEDKRFPKFGNLFLGLKNIFMLLYTTSGYYGIIGGCTRALFSLLKQSCLLPFYFKHFLIFFVVRAQIQKGVQRLILFKFDDMKCQYEYSLYCAEISMKIA